MQARNQLLNLEDSVPWTAVKSSWRNRRPGWRRSLKAADTVAEIAARLEEFRAHLMNDGATLPVSLQPADLPLWVEDMRKMCIVGMMI